MKKGIKLVSLAVVVSMISLLFTGCSSTPEGKALYNAFNKTQKVKTVQSSGDITLRISASGLSQNDQQTIGTVIPLLNNSKISINAKTEQNEDKTAVKSQADVNLFAAGMGMNMTAWVDGDMTKDQPSMREIIKMPPLAAMSMPAPFNSKEYMIMDFNEMMNSPELNQGAPVQPIDYSKMMKVSQDLQVKSEKFFEGYFAEFDPGFNFITCKKQQNIVTPAGEVVADIYTVKLNDEQAKELLKYIANDFTKNKDAKNFVKDYIFTVLDISNIKAGDKEKAKKEVENWFADFEREGSKSLENFNKTMDTLKNIKVLGDGGITIEYAVDGEGYIINEKGTIDLVLDIEKLSSAFGAQNGNNKATGIYNIAFDFNMFSYNINKEMNIQFPILTKENSYSYMDLIRYTMTQAAEIQKPKEEIKKVEQKVARQVYLVNVAKKNVKVYGKVYYVPSDMVLKGYHSYSNGVVTIKVNGNKASLKVGEKSIMVNGKKLVLKNTNAKVINGKVYLPLDVYQTVGVRVVVK
jgi:hypothetical protein